MLDHTGKPNHLNMRKNAVDDYNAGVRDTRLEMFSQWEREWADDGTLPAIGLRYVAIREDGTEHERDNFAAAMYAVWPDGSEAKGRVEYIIPGWMRDAEAMQAEYADERDTLATLRQS